MKGALTDQSEWLRPSEAAARLGISKVWLNSLADRGVVEAIKTPLGRLYRTLDVARLANERRARTTEREGVVGA